MDRVALALLVPGHGFEQPFERHGRLGDEAQRPEQPLDALTGGRSEPPQPDGQPRGDRHPDGHRFAVIHRTRALLDGMAERMAQIEFAPLAVFALVAAHDRGFEPHGVHHRLVHRLRIGAQAVESRPFDQPEKRLVADDPRLDRLGQSGADLAPGQRPEERRVADDEPRLREDARHILVALHIDTVLAADARIDAPQQRGRDESERNAPHVDGSREARDVGHDASPHTQQEGRTVGAAADQLAADRLDRPQRLVLLARLHADRVAPPEQLGTATGDRTIRQDDHPPRGQQTRQLLDGAPHHDAAASGHLQRIAHISNRRMNTRAKVTLFLRIYYLCRDKYPE